jgi:ABC-type nickel/cobalt efflux system permease component RcnA
MALSCRAPFHLLAAALALAVPRVGQAHPMGTLSTNRSALLVVGREETRLRYTVDFAEVPSVVEAARAQTMGVDAYAAARIGELLPGIHLSVQGRERPLRVDRCFGLTAKGEADLPLVTLLCELRASAVMKGRIRLEDTNFAGTLGWREMRIIGDTIAVGLGEPARAVSNGRTPLPFSMPPAEMTLASVEATAGVADTAGNRDADAAAAARVPDALASLVTADDLSTRFVALAFLAALVLGASHALSPGHGKTVVAAYLVGARGTVVQALLVGLTVTATHVSSVLLLGAGTLWLSQYVVAAKLYPWIGMASGLGVLAVGAGLFRSRWHAWHAFKAERVDTVRSMFTHDDAHADAHAHDHTHPAGAVHRHSHVPGEDDWLDHDHASRGHAHIQRDASGEPVSLARLLLLGVTGGAVPCPSALVVLLSAIALHRIVFGMLLIVSFSVGLAAVLMAIGVMAVKAQDLLSRFSGTGRAVAWMPVASAWVVMALGIGIAIQSAREGGLL